MRFFLASHLCPDAAGLCGFLNLSTGTNYQDLFNAIGKSPLGDFGKDILDVTKTLASMDATLLALGVTLAAVAVARSGVLPGIMGMDGRLISANRQAGFRGVAGVAHQRIGLGGGYAIGAGAAFYGAASIDPTSRGGAIAKGGLQGVGAGFLALSVGASPLVAAFAALTVAAIETASSFEEFRLKTLIEGNVVQRQGIGALAGSVGLLDVQTIAATRRHIEQLAIKDKLANEAPSIAAQAWAEAKKAVGDTPSWEDSGDATNRLRQTARETFLTDAGKSRALLEQYKNEFCLVVWEWIRSTPLLVAFYQ